MKIVLQKWEELDIRKLAEMTCEIRRYEGLGDFTVDQVEDYLKNMNDRFPIEIALLAVEGGRIIGWLGIERATKVIGEVGRWHPFIVSDVDQDAVAHQMISYLNNYATENGISRLEIGFGEIDENNLGAFTQRCSWFEREGWNKLDDSNFMTVNPMEVILDEPPIKDGFTFRPLLEVDNDSLFQCYHSAFTTGQATWIYDMSEEERRQEFDKNFERTPNINGPASFVINREGSTVGFTLVKSRSEDEEHLESIGVHPSYRGYGLGKLMLWRTIDELKKQNKSNLTLGVDPLNSPAVRLYEQIGFETISRTAWYVWKLSDAHVG